MITYQEEARSTSAGDNPLPPQRVEDFAKAIINDLLSETPIYNYNVDEAGIYSKHLSTLLKVRKGSGGLEAAKRTLETLLSQSHSPLASLLGSHPHHTDYTSTSTDANEDVNVPELPAAARLSPSLGKDASPWLDAYIEYSKKWSPRAYDSFHESTGLWVLSTASARRVFCHFGKKEYASLYIALVAHTTLHRKTTTANIGHEVLEEAGLKFLLTPNMVTPQKLMSDMAGKMNASYNDLSWEDQEIEKTTVAFSGQKGWYYEEFGMQLDAMMQKSGPMCEFRGLLRILDDHAKEYTYGTISRGKETIELPFLSLLSSMTPADIAPHAANNSKLWRDGLLARFVFATPPVGDKKKARFPEGARIVPPALVKKLVDWHVSLGMPTVEVEQVEDKKGEIRRDIPPKLTRLSFPETECVFGTGVLDAYYTYEETLIDLATDNDLYHMLGNYGRLPKAALRVCMLLASIENNGVMEMRHWARAQEIAERWRSSLHYMTAQMEISGQETGKLDETENLIVKTLVEVGPITANDLRRRKRQWRGIETKDFLAILDNLAKAGAIERVPQGKTVVYQALTPKSNASVA